MALFQIIAGIIALFVLYLFHVSRALGRTPPEAVKFSPPNKRWTKEELLKAYEATKKTRTDISKHLPPKLERRYVVVGGSGLVGGWIVQQLLWRGQDPSAIRVLDVRAPTRPEIAEHNVQFIQTDVTDSSSVLKALNAPWARECAHLPLTVFHTVAFIKAGDRKKEFLSKYLAVNVNGTQNVLEAAKKAGANCFVATSSGSVGVKPAGFFVAPWKKYPRDFFQVLVNAEPGATDMGLEDFSSCYAFSKAQAEKIVTSADSKKDGFRTGCIRPGHSIYGYGVENPSSIAWDYLRRGGTPTWLQNIVTNFVDAQNVAIAHLQFESRLVNPPNGTLDIGGRAYCVTDPSPPMTFGDFYLALSTLAHPSTPVRFPIVPVVPFLLLAYIIETYCLLRHHYFKFLPPVTGDLGELQPSLFNISTVNVVYDDSLAKKELGYKPPIETMEGVCLQLLEWNERQERNVAGKQDAGTKEKAAPKSSLPAVPATVAR